MSESYIREHFNDGIRAYADVIERRLDDSDCTIETVLRDNRRTLEDCQKAGLPYVLIDKEYDMDIQL